MNRNEQRIMNFVKNHNGVSSKEIFKNAALGVSHATTKRIINETTAVISNKFLSSNMNLP